MSDISNLPDEDRAVIRDALLQHRADGNPRPIIPAYEDLDGDGVTDFYGPDENEDVVLVSGVTIADTVAAEPNGDGFETGGAA